MTQLQLDARQLLSPTVFGSHHANAADEVANIAADLLEANNGKHTIRIDAVVLAAAIVEAIRCHYVGYMEFNLNRNPIATQIIDSVVTHLD